MAIFYFMCRPIIDPLIIIYIISFIYTIVSCIQKGIKRNKIKFTSHIAVIIAVVFICFNNSEIFKSERILTALLKDYLYALELVFRKNGKVENNVYGFL